MTVDVDVRKGTARLLLLCNDQAQAQANAFLAGRDPPRGSFLVARDVRGKATVRTGAARCPVSLIATAASGSSEAVTLTWRRPALEAAQSTGGPMIYCSGQAPARAPAR